METEDTGVRVRSLIFTGLFLLSAAVLVLALIVFSLR